MPFTKKKNLPVLISVNVIKINKKYSRELNQYIALFLISLI